MIGQIVTFFPILPSPQKTKLNQTEEKKRTAHVLEYVYVLFSFLLCFSVNLIAFLTFVETVSLSLLSLALLPNSFPNPAAIVLGVPPPQSESWSSSCGALQGFTLYTLVAP